MNKWIKRVVAIAFVIAQFLVIPTVSASSLENIQEEKKEIEEKMNKVQAKLDKGLDAASDLSTSLEKLDQEINEYEDSIVQTEEEIEEQEIIVEKRYDHTAEQLKAMQKNEVNHNAVLSLFQSESITEFFNTLYTMSVLAGANETQLKEAKAENDKLNELKEDLYVRQEELDEKKESTVAQQEKLDKQLASLKDTLTANQKDLEKLSAQEAKIEEEKKQEQLKLEEEKVKPATSQSSAAPKEEPHVESASNQKGGWMTFESTGYSMNEPGLSHKTATGIDLRQNSRVIAVDPSQIPLGSLVEIEGKGVYIAADTGGAIKGRIIDIHFNSISEMNRWGRRNVRLRIVG